MSLKERRDLVSLYRDANAALTGGVLFSVVRVAGSSYRQPGACMLVLADGRTAGTLSGGCLEAELLRRAAWTVRDGATVERFSTSFDDTAEIPYGLGCGGEIDLLAEPLGTPEAEALLEAFEATLAGQERTIATLLPTGTHPGPVTALRRIVAGCTGRRFCLRVLRFPPRKWLSYGTWRPRTAWKPVAVPGQSCRREPW